MQSELWATLLDISYPHPAVGDDVNHVSFFSFILSVQCVVTITEDHQLWARIARCLIERLQTSKTVRHAHSMCCVVPGTDISAWCYSQVKSQWNVCYAVGNMLKNPLLPQLAQA